MDLESKLEVQPLIYQNTDADLASRTRRIYNHVKEKQRALSEVIERQNTGRGSDESQAVDDDAPEFPSLTNSPIARPETVREIVSNFHNDYKRFRDDISRELLRD